MSNGKTLRVLVIEDEALIAMELESILTDLGHAVVGTAGTTGSALELLELLDPVPDVAIVDANLVGHSARPVVDALNLRGVRVVLASGYAADQLSRLGFDSPSVRKPYTERDIERALEET